MRVDYKDCYEYIDKHNYGISSISQPESHTIVYVMKKIQDKLSCLEEKEDCFVFFQRGIEIPNSLEEKHVFCETEDASIAFSKYIQDVFGEREKLDRQRKYTVVAEGYTVGENVSIGKGTYIEAGALIDHDVVIGDNCIIKREAILKHCALGDNCVVCERSFVGNTPYTYHKGEECLERTIAIGKVLIEDNVDVGAYSIIDRGSLSNTRIGFGSKIDSNVYIGHDVIIGRNVEITSGSLVGGFSEIGDEAKIYTANVMKRTHILKGAVIGFNSGVISDVKEGYEVFGYPARVLKKEI